MRPLHLMRAALIACALTLAACAGPAPVAQQNAETHALADAHMQSLEGDAALAPLWRKTSLALNEMTPAMLADPERASVEDRARLRELARRSTAYEARMTALFQRHQLDARLISQWQAGAQAIAQLRAQLHNGALTWGEYNTRVRELNTAQRGALADLGDALAPNASDEARISARRSQQAAREMVAALAVAPAGGNCEVIGVAAYCR